MKKKYETFPLFYVNNIISMSIHKILRFSLLLLLRTPSFLSYTCIRTSIEMSDIRLPQNYKELYYKYVVYTLIMKKLFTYSLSSSTISLKLSPWTSRSSSISNLK